jgi:hypothetical protein
MRAHEFITESVTDGLSIASYALPNTYVIPELKNNDFYELYRFGVAIADVRGTSGPDDGVQNEFKHDFKAESIWGENQVVSSEFDADIGQIIDQALAKVGKRGKKQFSTPTSDEIPNTGTQSTLKPFKGYKR